MSRQTKRLWRNRLIFIAVVALGITGYIIFINAATVYDFSHLTRRMDLGESRPFTPLSGPEHARVPNMVLAAETAYLALYINMEDTTFAVYDKRNGVTWHSAPQGPEHIANALHRGIMRSNMGFSFYDHNRRRQHRWTFQDAAEHGQFEIHAIDNGVRFNYVVGNLDIGLHFLPRYIEETFFREYIYARFEDDPSLARFMRLQWVPSEEHEGFLRLTDAIFGNPINTQRKLGGFDAIGWTYEDTIYHNAKLNYEPDISFDFFDAVFEIALDRDRLIVNVPIDGIQPDGEIEAQIFSVDILRFFGAGCAESEGFMLVPSGAGGLIRFNNGRYREPAFSAPVYGTDFIMTSFFPQMEQPTRLPVLGIQNNGAGIIAHVYSGQGLASVNAEVAAETPGVGTPNAQNNAWFNFLLRQSVLMDMSGIPGAVAGDLRAIQQDAYDGDLTVIYHFLPGENPCAGVMAQAYQQFLVEQGVLTPLDGPGDRSFYLDILGALDVRRHILGTPYTTSEVMTSLEEADRFVDIFQNSGINTIQMQLHGWFNRGINHDVAKRVNVMNRVGNQSELQAMNTRLQADGGGLHPVVNFQLTNWYSRNFIRRHETARDPAGYLGFLSRIARDMMFTRSSIHYNDWFILVHPAVIPFHVDRFIPNFERRVGIDGLALSDMGDIITESLYRRDPVNREHSRLIAEAQMGRLYEAFPNLVVFGGNDYSLQFASHIVDAPIVSDRFHIIDYEVPFFPMVLHGFIEFAGRPANMWENYSPIGVLLNSMTTGAGPRYILTHQPTRQAQFSPHERFYSTHYERWLDVAIDHYHQFNDVFRYLRGERMIGFEILLGRHDDIITGQQVTVTTFSNGTRIYVNNTLHAFDHNGVLIPPQWFVVKEA